MSDPFSTIPDADPAELELRRPWVKKDNTVELVGKTKRKKVDLNPLQRKWFDRNGYVYHRVEVANPFGAVTSDMWGIADYIAVKPGEILLVQVTTMDHAANREKKVRKAPELAAWLKAGGRFQVHAWKQPGGKGSRWENVVREVEGPAPAHNASTAHHNGQQAPSRVGCGQAASESAAGVESSLRKPERMNADEPASL